MAYPKQVLNFINHKSLGSLDNKFFDKINPVNENILAKVTRSNARDLNLAIQSAQEAFPSWSETSVVERGLIIRKAAILLEKNRETIAKIIALETGKSLKDALGETQAAIELGFFISSEGRRFYGRTTTSAVPNRFAYTIRQPIGIVGLIIAANTPIANVAWKAFPALICGNACIMKPSEDTPFSAIWFGQILAEAGLPAGVFNVLQGFGPEIGAALVEGPAIDLISFTGSVEVGRWIQKTAGERLAKVCLELGGKNPLVVCDDADVELAVQDTISSAFSNAGQRCASGSRIIIFESIYNQFKKLLLSKTKQLKLGNKDSDDLGPVINQIQLDNMLETVKQAARDGAKILIGGKRAPQPGYYIMPTILEDVNPNHEISICELFGPITCLYKVKNLNQAIELANQSEFGLTAAIHSSSIHKTETFKNQVQTGVISINGPTYGSEPHLPFGGVKNSGNGFREPGTESLDIYSEWKTVYVKHFPKLI